MPGFHMHGPGVGSPVQPSNHAPADSHHGSVESAAFADHMDVESPKPPVPQKPKKNGDEALPLSEAHASPSNTQDVPYISQLGIGGHAGTAGHDENNGCWYASARMMAHAPSLGQVQAGPRHGLPELYDPKHAGDPNAFPRPVSGDQMGRLARNEGLEPVRGDEIDGYTHRLTGNPGSPVEDLGHYINQHGPLMIAVKGHDGRVVNGQAIPPRGGHAVVATGVDTRTNEVLFNDPHQRSEVEGRQRTSYDNVATADGLMYRKHSGVDDLAESMPKLNISA